MSARGWVGRLSGTRASTTQPPSSRAEPGADRPARSGDPDRIPLPRPGPRPRPPVPEPKGWALRVVLVSRDNMLAGALRSLIEAPGGVRVLDWYSEDLDAAIRHADVVIVDMPPNLHERTFAVIDGRFLGRMVVLLQEGEHAEALPAGPARVVLYRPVQIGELWMAVTGATPPVTADPEPSAPEDPPPLVDTEVDSAAGSEAEAEPVPVPEPEASAPEAPEPEPESVPEPEPEPEVPELEPEAPDPEASEPEAPEEEPALEALEPGTLEERRDPPPEAAVDGEAPADEETVGQADAAAAAEVEPQGLPVAESGRLIGLSGQELDPVIGPGQVAPGMDHSTLERLRGWGSRGGQPAARGTGPAPGTRTTTGREEAHQAKAAQAEARRAERTAADQAKAAEAEARREQSARDRAARAEAEAAAREEARQAKAAQEEARLAARAEAERERAARAQARTVAREEARQAKAARAAARTAAREEARQAKAAKAEAERLAREAKAEAERLAREAKAEEARKARAAQAEAEQAAREARAEEARRLKAEAEARQAAEEAKAEEARRVRAAKAEAERVAREAKAEEAQRAKAAKEEARAAARAESRQAKEARAEARQAARVEARQAKAARSEERRAARTRSRQERTARAEARRAEQAEARQARAAAAEAQRTEQAEARRVAAAAAEVRRAEQEEARRVAREKAGQTKAERAEARQVARGEARQARAERVEARRVAREEAGRARAARRAEARQARSAKAEARRAARAEAKQAKAAATEARREQTRQARAERAAARKQARAEAGEARAAKAAARKAARAGTRQAKAAQAEERRAAQDEARRAKAAQAEERRAARAEAEQAKAAEAQVRREQAQQAKAARAEERRAARHEAKQARATRSEERRATRAEAKQAKAARVEARRQQAEQARAARAQVREAARAEASEAKAEARRARAARGRPGVVDVVPLALVVVALAAVGLGAAGWRGSGGPDTLAGEVAVVRAAGGSGGLVAQDPRVGPIEPLHALAVGAWLRATEAGGSLEGAIREARVPSRFLLAGVVVLTMLLFLLLMRVGPGSGAAAGPGPAPPQLLGRDRRGRRWRLGAAALAGGLVALDPVLVLNGRAATGTVLAVVLALGALAVAWGLPTRPALRWLPLVAAVGGLALLVSPLALGVLAVPVVAELLQGRHREAWRDMAALGLGVGVWLALPIWVAGQGLDAGRAGWLLGRPPGRGAIAASLAAAPLTWLLVAAGLAAAVLPWRPRPGARSEATPGAARLLAWTATTAAGALVAIVLGYPAEQALPFAVPAAAVSVALAATRLATGAQAGGARKGPAVSRLIGAGVGIALAGLLVAQGADWGSRYGTSADDGLARLVATVGGELPACSAVNASGPDDRARLLAAGATVTEFSDGPAALAAGVRYFVVTGATQGGPATPSLAAWVRQHGTRVAVHPSRSLSGLELWRVDAAPLDPVADALPVPDGVFSNTSGSACGGYRVVDGQTGRFYTAYRAVGGKTVLGRPLGTVWTSDGPALQAFDTMVLGAVPASSGPPAVAPIELPPLLAKLDVEAVADADIPLPSARPPVTDRQAQALLKDRLIAREYLGTDPGTASAADWRQARARFGRPLGLPQVMPDGAVRQTFERVVLELPADGGPARPAALGRLAVRLGLVPRQAMRLEPVPGLPARPSETQLDTGPLLRLVGGALALLVLAAGVGVVAAWRSRPTHSG